jgi:hypothetical protein
MNLIATEQQEQIALMQWAALHPICKDYLIHIPNGGSRHPLEAKNLKRMGVKAGVSDLFLAYPQYHYDEEGMHGQWRHGLWIELKSKKGKVTNTQLYWLSQMQERNYIAEVAYGWEEARDIISRYLGE